MGKSSRDKGKRGEYRWRDWLRAFWPAAARGAQFSGPKYCDVEGTPYWIEAKEGKRVRLRDAMKQAERDTDGRPPIVLAHDTRGQDWVVMRPDTLAVLLEAAHRDKRRNACRPVGGEL